MGSAGPWFEPCVAYDHVRVAADSAESPGDDRSGVVHGVHAHAAPVGAVAEEHQAVPYGVPNHRDARRRAEVSRDGEGGAEAEQLGLLARAPRERRKHEAVHSAHDGRRPVATARRVELAAVPGWLQVVGLEALEAASSSTRGSGWAPRGPTSP